jgi:hypothetical protein
MNKQSGQEVAKQGNGFFSKTDVCYWQKRDFQADLQAKRADIGD